MSKDKHKVRYSIDKSYTDKWRLNITRHLEYDTVEHAIEALRAMYAMENLELVDVAVSLDGNEVVDIFMKGEK
jgi:hypothetical protein